MSEASAVIFGGSFNPFGLQHLRTIRYLQESFRTVIVLPAHNHPFKTDLAPFDLRLRMAKAALMGQKAFVSAAASDIQSPYAYDQLCFFARILGHQNIAFAIGEDLKEEIKKWHKGDLIHRDFSFHVTPEWDIGHSTDIRNLIQRDQDFWRELVPATVAALIEEHGLYR